MSVTQLRVFDAENGPWKGNGWDGRMLLREIIRVFQRPESEIYRLSCCLCEKIGGFQHSPSKLIIEFSTD